MISIYIIQTLITFYLSYKNYINLDIVYVIDLLLLLLDSEQSVEYIGYFTIILNRFFHD